MDTTPYYEDINNGLIKGILSKFYSNGEESQKQYSAILQVSFLTVRYQALKLAMMEDNAILDSNLLSDSILAGNLHKNGNMSDEEYNVYLTLNQEMQANVNGRPWNGLPDLILYIKISPEKELEEIKKRGREMELDPKLVEYYRTVNKAYADWYTGYSQSPVITIDRDKYDFVNNIEDRQDILDMIYHRLYELGKLDVDKYLALEDNLEKLSISDITDGTEVNMKKD